MQKDEFFSYYWFLDEREQDVTSIRVYGLNNKNENVCIRVDDFQPYIYFELPDKIEWTASKAQLLGDKIDFIMKEHKPLKKRLDMKYRLYGANLDINENKKMFPYLYCSFSNKNDIKKAFYMTKKPLNIIGIGNISLKIHEQDADPILQFVSNRDIPTAGWISFIGKEVKKDDKITYCEKEYIVSWNNVKKINKDMVGKPKIMGFDIEVNSTNPSAMPKAEIQGDKIFQISCVFSRFGESEDDYDIYLLTLGEPDAEIVGENVTIYMYNSEIELLEGFTELITTENPNVIVGYNILGFDIPYMIDRAKFPCLCFNNFDKMGFNKFAHAKEKTIKWSSSAYGNQEFQFLDAEGRLFVDLLPLIKRDYKMNNYTLKTVSDFFIGDKKDDLSAKGIFKCYRVGTKKEKDGTYSNKAKKAIAVCGKYCVKDTVLVMKLMEKIQTWVGLTEQAATYNTSIFSIYTQGQQIKVYSQVYKYCFQHNIVVEKDGYVTKENERYVGAHVFPPVPGLYERVLPFDFCSLYPTTIIAYNIDYSTIVFDESIPDEKCNVMSWNDHISCEHDPKVIKKNKLTKYIDSQKEKLKELRKKRDNKLNKLIKQDIIDDINKIVEDLKPFTKERSDIVKKLSKNPMCEKRYYRFLKEPKGVMPTILQNLLDARKNTRKIIKDNKNKLEILNDEKEIDNIKRLNNVLDKRQLAYKVSANSMYGAMGVKKGYLPFMPGAMVTTYMGRVNIELVAKTIPEKYGGQLVYGDTDSNYITFPQLKSKTAAETWDYAVMVANEVSKLFPKAMKLEYEEAIYEQFFILTKKRYLYTSCNREGVIDKKIGKRGVAISRRDNSLLLRILYEKVIQMIFDRVKAEDILYFLLEELNKVCSRSCEYSNFVLTKSIKDVNNMELISFKDEKGKIKGKIGDYIVKILPNTKKEREEQLKKKEADTEEEYYAKCLPAVVQLAEKMRNRGQRVDIGSRIEYVITDNGVTNDKQYNKLENLDYFLSHSDILKIDYMYYIKLLCNPIDEMLNVAFKDMKKDFMLEQYEFRLKRNKMLNQIKELHKPKLKLLNY